MARRNVGGPSPSGQKPPSRLDLPKERPAQAATEMMQALEDDGAGEQSPLEGGDATDATRVRAAPAPPRGEDFRRVRAAELDAGQCLRAALESLITAQSHLHSVPPKDKQRVAAGAYLIDRAIAEVREKLAGLRSR